jgi:hypothetical protein
MPAYPDHKFGRIGTVGPVSPPSGRSAVEHVTVVEEALA